MARDFDRGASGVDSGSWSLAGGWSRPFEPGLLLWPIGPRGGRSRLPGSAGRVLAARKQSFTLELKQPGFDRTGTTKSPQQTC